MSNSASSGPNAFDSAPTTSYVRFNDPPSSATSDTANTRESSWRLRAGSLSSLLYALPTREQLHRFVAPIAGSQDASDSLSISPTGTTSVNAFDDAPKSKYTRFAELERDQEDVDRAPQDVRSHSQSSSSLIDTPPTHGHIRRVTPQMSDVRGRTSFSVMSHSVRSLLSHLYGTGTARLLV